MRLLPAAVIVGIGIAGTVDEVVFHQLLHWHHFYDRTTDLQNRDTARLGLITDGIFHVVSTLALIVGFAVLCRARAAGGPGWSLRRVWAGLLIGAGGFNLYDGVVQHKLLRLHQVREGVHPETPYDIVLIAASAAVLLAGVLLLRRTEAVDRGRAR
jgi:uncharacterized membrane protein